MAERIWRCPKCGSSNWDLGFRGNQYCLACEEEFDDCEKLWQYEEEDDLVVYPVCEYEEDLD